MLNIALNEIVNVWFNTKGSTKFLSLSNNEDSIPKELWKSSLTLGKVNLQCVQYRVFSGSSVFTMLDYSLEGFKFKSQHSLGLEFITVS